MHFILGTKLGMTQVFNEQGNVIPVSIVSAGPCTVIQVRTKDKDGYEAVQLGFGKRKSPNKPLSGHLKGLDAFRHIKEFRTSEGTDLKRGDVIQIDIFKDGDKINIQGVSKGKGFQGTVKRHGFHGGPKSHGQKHRLRAPGSIGSTALQRVAKGKKMSGRMGGQILTVKNLKVIKVIPEENLIFIKGALPGTKDEIIKIYK